MRKIFQIILLTFIIIISIGFVETPCRAQSASNVYKNYNDMVEKAKELDGKTLDIEGEAIGEPLKRGDYTWVNICDGNGTSIGIYMKTEDASSIKYYGSSKVKGDTIIVSGEFRRACKEHGGDLDVHADKVNIEKPGHKIIEEVKMDKLIFSAVLTFIAAIASFFYFREKKNA